MQYRLPLLVSSLALSLAACSSDAAGPKTDADYEAEVVNGMHDTLLTDIDALHGAAVNLAAAAPDHAWDADADADAIAALKDAWMAARAAYEQSEGALAPLFPDLDTAIDARYDDFLEELAPGGDQALFDGQGVTGMHAIERILYAPVTPQAVIDFEATLPGYKAAAWPATDEEANEFKTELCAQLVTDTQTLKDQWSPQHIDLQGSYDGLTALMNEQREKVNKAASEEEESRYSQRTMADIRDNLTGTEKVYALFRPWLATKSDGKTIDGEVQTAFGDLATAYAAVDGDAFPPLPADWSSENPPADALSTPFGQLYTAVQTAVDPNRPGSAVDAMNRAATALGFVGFSE
jgi:iron uptake system component EfeO